MTPEQYINGILKEGDVIGVDSRTLLEVFSIISYEIGKDLPSKNPQLRPNLALVMKILRMRLGF